MSCSQVLQPFLPGEGAVVGSGISSKELGNCRLGGIDCTGFWGASSVDLHPVSVLQVAQTSLGCGSGRVLVSCPSAGGRALSVWGRRGIRGLSLQRREWMRTGGWPVAGRSEDARACPGLEQVSWLCFGVRVKRAVHLETCGCKSCYLPTCPPPCSLQLPFLALWGRSFSSTDGACSPGSSFPVCVNCAWVMGMHWPFSGSGGGWQGLALLVRGCSSEISFSNTP